ncbi:MAG: hypothetical protein CL943_02750 [Candidatus Diapherotrites archaeon]|uniref:Polymerase/histidinol phosphatase N-terminal domain-containing protein n=1 Tax=Candidatus Iainarchaeum sp. TaxID=3101447 RepID=A0A2D6M199_9ARCH|nr:hypothetical protein [Candidatus Diapherotrites archaeon]|tara:strand:- start:3727 stop:4596 length:870 start_codon:yes stop_codon:yes gene_type:complete
MIDLHMHTSASDGKLSPKEVVALSLKKGLSAIAITDHDSISGIGPAIARARGKDIEIIPGIEINCDGEEAGFKEVEVVGLFVDPSNEALIKFTQNAKQDRFEQKKKIVAKLQDFGFDISFDELKAFAKGSIGRPHIARLLVKKYPEKFSSIRDVFVKLLRVGKPAHVDRENKSSIKQAISIVKEAGGLSFLAHPGVFPKEKSLDLIKFFKKQGGQGIETYYPYYMIVPELKIGEKENLELIKFYQKTANDLGLLEAGGSDFHGGDRETINAVEMPETVLEKLKEASKKN